MLDWFLVSCGGAAVYAASRWLKARAAASNIRKKQQQLTGKYGQPLRVVVAQCEARWFLQELQLAMAGDAEAMVRVSHMLMASYGTQQDHTAAARWMRQAWAIQNYKEPGQLHDMLDVRDSAVPALNDAAGQPAGQAPVQQAAAAAAAAAATSSRRSHGRSRRGGGRQQQEPHSGSSSSSSSSAAADTGRAAAAASSSGAAAEGCAMQNAVKNSSCVSCSTGDAVVAGSDATQLVVQLSSDGSVADTQSCTLLQQGQQQPRTGVQHAQQMVKHAEHQLQPNQQQRSQRQQSGLATAGQMCRELLRQQGQQHLRMAAVAAAANAAHQHQLQQAGTAALSMT